MGNLAAPAPPIRVLVVDDSAFMRHAIVRILGARPEVEVAGTANDGVEAQALVRRLRPDVVTLDVDMPHMDGLRALAVIMRDLPTPVVMLSSLTTADAEPYSLAIALDEALPGLAHYILATDIDQTVLARAAHGSGYTEADLRGVDDGRRARYFRRDAGGRFSVAPTLRARVQFRRHDLVRGATEQNLDLIVCRNVVIYFTNDAKAGLYRRLRGALRPQGGCSWAARRRSRAGASWASSPAARRSTARPSAGADTSIKTVAIEPA